MEQTAGKVRERWSEFLFWLSVFFGLIHFAGIIAVMAGYPVRSSFMTGNIYLGALAAYVSQKELRRWLNAPDADVVPEDVQRKFNRGELIVGAWAALTGIAAALWNFNVIQTVPEQLLYTFGEVMGIYFGSNASKYFKNKNIKTSMETDSIAASCAEKAVAIAKTSGSVDNETCQREFDLSRGQAYRLLSRLEKQGKLKAQGIGKAISYVLP